MVLLPNLLGSVKGDNALFFPLVFFHVIAALAGFGSIAFAGTYASRAAQIPFRPQERARSRLPALVPLGPDGAAGSAPVEGAPRPAGNAAAGTGTGTVGPAGAPVADSDQALLGAAAAMPASVFTQVEVPSAGVAETGPGVAAVDVPGAALGPGPVGGAMAPAPAGAPEVERRPSNTEALAVPARGDVVPLGGDRATTELRSTGAGGSTAGTASTGVTDADEPGAGSLPDDLVVPAPEPGPTTGSDAPGAGPLGETGAGGAPDADLPAGGLDAETEEIMRYFQHPARFWPAVLAVPVFGLLALAVEPHTAGLDQVWTLGGLLVWMGAVLIMLSMVLPGLRQMRTMLLTPTEPAGTPAVETAWRARLARAGAMASRGAAVCDVLFFVALALMIWRP